MFTFSVLHKDTLNMLHVESGIPTIAAHFQSWLNNLCLCVPKMLKEACCRPLLAGQ